MVTQTMCCPNLEPAHVHLHISPCKTCCNNQSANDLEAQQTQVDKVNSFAERFFAFNI